MAACEVALAVEERARSSRSGTTVGTVGVVRVEPGAVNVIPGRVTIDIDIRDSDLASRTYVVDGVLAEIRVIGERRGVEVEIETTVHDLPAACAPEIVAAVRGACENEQISWRAMTSGAYHDAMVLGPHMPMGMIFIPSRDGLSHHPDEYTAPEELELGVRVLAGALRTLTAEADERPDHPRGAAGQRLHGRHPRGGRPHGRDRRGVVGPRPGRPSSTCVVCSRCRGSSTRTSTSTSRAPARAGQGGPPARRRPRRVV